MIRLIVDSTCDLPSEIMEQHDMLMLPLRVLLNGIDYRDKVDITPDAVYDAMREGVVPKTSQVAPEDMHQMFGRLCENGDDFVYLAFSSALSGTCQLAAAILLEYAEKYPHLHMQVVDSKSGSMATGLIALQIAQMIKAGYPFDQIVLHATNLAEHVEHVFTIADIGWLVKGGRISKLTGMLGSILDVRPILDVKNGFMEVIKKARGSQKAVTLVVDTLAERISAFPGQVIAIAHSENYPGVEKLKKMLTEKLGATGFMISKIGSVLGSHLGIGGLGVFFFNQQPEPYFNGCQ